MTTLRSSQDMISSALAAYEKDESAVVWWVQDKGCLAKDFLEKILQRSLITFNCY